MSDNENNVTLDNFIDFENGDMDDERAVVFFQKIINSGLVWKLQGFYGRTARDLINQGLCHKP